MENFPPKVENFPPLQNVPIHLIFEFFFFLGSGKFSTKVEKFPLSLYGMISGTLECPDAEKKFLPKRNKCRFCSSPALVLHVLCLSLIFCLKFKPPLTQLVLHVLCTSLASTLVLHAQCSTYQYTPNLHNRERSEWSWWMKQMNEWMMMNEEKKFLWFRWNLAHM